MAFVDVTFFRSERAICGTLLAIILLSSLGLKLDNLGHTAITPLDEVFHAIVARNLLKHPLTPTLYEKQYLDSEAADWQNSGVWMHKPPLALWQIAMSFAMLGQTALALRIPSALLATGAAWLTYLIGAVLVNRRAALIGAALQALNPATLTLVHGYIFSDHVDVALLFWTELGIWFVVRASFPACSGDACVACNNVESSKPAHLSHPRSAGFNAILAGIAQGLAFLTKTYPALIVTVVLVVAWLAARGRSRLRGRHVLICLATTLLVIAPWTIWSLAKFPREFRAAHSLIIRHLHTDVENWAAPWDRLIFDYLLRTYHVFYPMLLAAIVIVTIRAARLRDAKLLTLLAWLLGAIVPFTLATSKTPTAALVGWPAGWLLLAYVIDRALRGDAAMLGISAAALLVGCVWPGAFPREGMGYSTPRVFAGVLRQNLWSLWHAIAALAGGVLFALVAPRLSARDRRSLGFAAAVLTVAAGSFLFVRYAALAGRIAALARQDPANREIGLVVRAALPKDAVILVDESRKLEHKVVMFWADRAAYPYAAASAAPATATIRSRGGEVYILTLERLPLPAVLADSSGRTLYRVR